ncbi:MAG: T9SS type A sorting domain-containing protein [Bacteroidales bacterium]|nr:T9SS type A sorting domain-containing protein [Bacteroidales bacterium]
MPVAGDTLRLSTAISLNGIDPTLSGAGYTWDFSSLGSLSQAVDTFLAITAVPVLYQLFFNNPLDPNKANLALRTTGLDIIPGFEIGDVYEFYRSNSAQYAFLGYAGELSGIPLPVKYDQPDVWYRFPLEYGDLDSSRSVFNLSLPGLGTFFSDRKRKNIVDGWGQLTTPFGSFQALRVRSEVVEYDSLYLDTLGGGFAFNRIFTEYKWLAKGYDVPVLQVTQEGPLATVTYLDSADGGGTSVKEPLAMEAEPLTVSVDPHSGTLLVSLQSNTPGRAYCLLNDIQGSQLLRQEVSIIAGGNSIALEPASRLKSGIYFLQLSDGERVWFSKFLVP